MDIEEMKKTMLEDPAATMRDKDADSIMDKISNITKLLDKADEQNDGDGINTKITPALIVKKQKSIGDNIKEAVMKNTKAHHGSNTGSGDLSGSNKLVNELVPQIFDNLAAKHFVGIQPMQGPVGLIYSLEIVTQEKEPVTDDEFAGTFAENTSQRLSLNIVSRAIEAGSRKLETSIEIEPLMDDIEGNTNSKKYNTAVDIAKEIYTEIRNDIAAVAHKDSVTIKDDYNPMNLCIAINHCANEIARKTRRGAGNFVIVSETVADILKDDIKINTDLIYNQYDYVNYVGTINGNTNVYRDLDIEYNKVIIGYKGTNGETDAGFFYAPYVPLMASVVVNPTTFQPIVKLMTRYGKYVNQLTEENVSDDGATTTIKKEKCNYYYELTFENLPKAEKNSKLKKVTKEKDSSILESSSDIFDAAMELLD